MPTENLDSNGAAIISYQRATSNFPINWHSAAGLPVDGSDADLLVDSHLGWYMDLVNTEGGNTDGKGERSVSNPMLRDGSIIFVTAIPDQDPCSYGGSSWYMELNAVTGARPETAIIDIDGDGDIDEDDYIDTIAKNQVASSGARSASLSRLIADRRQLYEIRGIWCCFPFLRAAHRLQGGSPSMGLGRCVWENQARGPQGT